MNDWFLSLMLTCVCVCVCQAIYQALLVFTTCTPTYDQVQLHVHGLILEHHQVGFKIVVTLVDYTYKKLKYQGSPEVLSLACS